MKMKKTTVTIVAALAAVSCSGLATENTPSGQEGPGMALLTVNISEAGHDTKSTLTTWADGTVSSASVFVFNSDGTYDNSATASGTSVTLKCTVGTGKQVYVVVNKTISGAIADVASLEAVTTTLTDNSSGHFVMTGKAAGVSVSSGDNDPVNIEVVRHAAKISIDKITNSLTESGWKDLPFKVTGIFLVNAAGGDPGLFASGYTPSTWYNKTKYVPGAADGMLYDALDATVANTSSLSATHTFYCMPNPTATDTSNPTWSPRKTRLAVEVTIGEQTFYYPVTLDNVVRNTHYSISNLNITRLGSSSPDIPVESSTMTFSISVKSWTEVLMGTQTI